MVEKFKDFMYDISDIFFSLLIIVGIFLIVTWKISTSMSFELLPTYFTSSEDTQKVLNEVKVVKNTNPSTAPTDETVDASEDTSSEEGTDTTDEGSTTEDSSETTSEGNDSTVKVIEDVQIVVAPGSSGYSIAKQLVDKGLITDINTFNNRVDEMGLAGKLQQGNFTLSTGDTLDNMIRILCGRSRE